MRTELAVVFQQGPKIDEQAVDEVPSVEYPWIQIEFHAKIKYFTGSINISPVREDIRCQAIEPAR